MNFKFKRESESETKQWLDPEDEHVMNWFQMESFPKFFKLWGKVDATLEAGNYTMVISNQWDTSEWSGKKSLYFSQASFFGGKQNLFLGLLFFLFGLLTVAIIIAMIVMECTLGA